MRSWRAPVPRLVRITVNSPEAAAQVAAFAAKTSTARACRCRWSAISTTTAIACLPEFPDCAQALAKYRINPGNVGKGSKRDEQFATMIDIACRYDKPVRIGVNWGSLDQNLLARMMDENARLSATVGSR